MLLPDAEDFAPPVHAAALTPPLAPPAAPRSQLGQADPAQATKRKAPPLPIVYRKAIRVDMSRREVAVYEDGVLVKLITHAGFGRSGHETPLLHNASLSINRRERMHHSRKYDDAPMPYALFLNESPGVAFHAGNVGGRSHGCIRLRAQDAKWLFGWVGHDPVKVEIRADSEDRIEVALERRKLTAPAKPRATPAFLSDLAQPPEPESAGAGPNGPVEDAPAG